MRQASTPDLIAAMPSPSDAAPAPATPGVRARPLLTLIGLLGLAAVTLANPGATRMYAWPWVFA